LIGKWFKRTGKRNEIFLASKFGLVMGPGRQFKGINSSPEYCKEACEESLRKLGIDCIDLCESLQRAWDLLLRIMKAASLTKRRLRSPRGLPNADRADNACDG